MKQRSMTLIAALLLLCSAWPALAAYEIFFHSGTVVPEAGRYAVESVLPGTHVVVQFNSTPTPSQRARLDAAGVKLLGYLPENAYAASMAQPLSGNEWIELGVRAVLPFAPEYKLHPRMIEGEFGSWSDFGDGRRMLNVDIFADVTLADAAALITKTGFEVGDEIEGTHTLVVAADPGKVMELAALEPVLFINEMSPPFESLNSTVRTRLHVNEVQAEPYNLSGDGVTILVYDGGLIDSTHPDFGDRVTAMETGTVADHPTHVAGTVGGNGGNLRGMAPAVNIVSGQYNACTPFCFYNSPNDVSDDYTFARQNFSVEVTTNSMGANVSPNGYPCAWFGDYELSSRVIDGLVAETDDRPLIQFWAAGNERGDPGCANSSYRCMSIPASAKNIITVGATTSTDAVASFSSFGPTDDGRVKPEVVATGVNVNSCAPGGGYQIMSGTSMATPATAGVGCLILERWHQLYPGSPDPLPEAMKALLINSATDLGNVGPDFQTGYGIVNAQRAIDQLSAGGVIQSTLGADQPLDFEFNVPENTPFIDVSLAWTDVPALGNVIPTLVNDLDIVLISPANLGYQPWVLNPSSPGTAAQPGEDSVNVCEKVRVTNPLAGTWRARVLGDINVGETQTFALASSVPLATEWTSVSGRLFWQEAPTFGVAGVVTVPDAGIRVMTDPTTGEYSFSVPSGREYEMHGVGFSFQPASVTFTASGSNMTRDLGLSGIDVPTEVTGTVVDQFDAPISGAVVSVSFPNMPNPIPDVTTNASGQFTLDLPGNELEFHVAYNGLSVDHVESIPIGNIYSFTIVLNDSRIRPVGPDGGGYYCYENADTGYAPTFAYTSIAPAGGGPGTLIGPGTGNDWMIQVALPFNVRFYGVITGGLTVSADGWIGFGNTPGGAQPWTNTFVPNSDQPNNCIYVFWDDMYPYNPTEGGQIASYYDSLNGRFIVEYYEVPHFQPTTLKVTAQVILYTQGARPTSTGDTEIEIHYNRFDYDGPDTDQDATLGIENSNGSTGLMVYFDGGADPYQYPIAAGTTLRYTTGPVLGTGTVSGQITALPATDLSGATVRIGALAFAPEADGSFSVAGISAGTMRVSFEFAGYEDVESEQITLPPDGEVTVNLTSYQLNPPTNLDGEWDPEANQIRIHWNRPTWGAGLRDPGNNPLDALSDYTVLIQGRTPVTGIADTFLVYTPTQQGFYRMWVVANYDGGISDSSNGVQFTVTPAEDAPGLLPTELTLSQNYPNPFNPTTQISFGLPTAAEVRLDVFDITGRTVAQLLHQTMQAGYHRVDFDGAKLGSGVYFYRLNTGGQQIIRKMMLLR